MEERLGGQSAWLRVHTIEAQAAEDDTRAPFRGQYEVVGGDAEVVAELGSRRDSLAMNGSAAKEIERALPLGEVYVNTGGQRAAGDVRFALLVTRDDFAFLGICKRRTMTEPLKQRFGDKAYATVRGWVGKTGSEMLSAFPPRPTPRSSTGSVFLNPETAPQELLASLRIVTFTVAPAPDSWLGPYTVCTRIRQGWSDCIDLSQQGTSGLLVDAYVDPAAPTLEVWLLDGRADVRRPLARLGTVDVGALAKRTGLRLEDGPRLVVTLDGASSPTAAAADDARAARSMVRVELRRHTP